MTFFQNGILGVSVQPIFQLISRGAALHMQNFDERQALDGLRSFDSQTIGAIYDKYFPEIYRYVRYRLNDEHLAEDIASALTSAQAKTKSAKGKPSSKSGAAK